MIINIGISPQYFLDEMSMDEIEAVLKTRDNIRKEEWEKIRYQCFYSVISFNGTKVYKKPSDMFRFPWEKKTKKSKGKKYNAEELRQKEERAKKYIKRING